MQHKEIRCLALSVPANSDGAVILAVCYSSQGPELSGDTGHTVAPQAWDDRGPGVLLSDRCWTEITRKNRKCTEQQLGQTNSTSHLLLIYTFISQTPFPSM